MYSLSRFGIKDDPSETCWLGAAGLQPGGWSVSVVRADRAEHSSQPMGQLGIRSPSSQDEGFPLPGTRPCRDSSS